MPEVDSPALSDVQHEVMTVVWDPGKCSASDVWKIPEERRDVSRNTVHTFLARLEENGWLTRNVSNWLCQGPSGLSVRANWLCQGPSNVDWHLQRFITATTPLLRSLAG